MNAKYLACCLQSVFFETLHNPAMILLLAYCFPEEHDQFIVVVNANRLCLFLDCTVSDAEFF